MLHTPIVLVIALLLVVLFGSLTAYAIHWVMHRSWSGHLYRSHMEHHKVHYPPRDLYSMDRYRSSGWSSGWLTFTPLVVASGIGVMELLALLHLGGARWVVVVLFALVGWVHGYVHDAFHVRLHWLGRFASFRRLRRLHEPHHSDMNTNLGILWFGWDRVFGTFHGLAVDKSASKRS